MLKFTQQANEDLTSILEGLIEFRINDSRDPSLSLEHAERIFDDIANHIAQIPMLSYHRPNTFPGLMLFGTHVYTYKRNRTSWYAFYFMRGDLFIVTRITNNWNILFPRM